MRRIPVCLDIALIAAQQFARNIGGTAAPVIIEHDITALQEENYFVFLFLNLKSESGFINLYFVRKLITHNILTLT